MRGDASRFDLTDIAPGDITDVIPLMPDILEDDFEDEEPTFVMTNEALRIAHEVLQENEAEPGNTRIELLARFVLDTTNPVRV